VWVQRERERRKAPAVLDQDSKEIVGPAGVLLVGQEHDYLENCRRPLSHRSREHVCMHIHIRVTRKKCVAMSFVLVLRQRVHAAWDVSQQRRSDHPFAHTPGDGPSAPAAQPGQAAPLVFLQASRFSQR
jgi:hypothetical protein